MGSGCITIYLDYNATAPLLPSVKARMSDLLGSAHNPSSVHKAGREAKRILEDSRKTIAEAINVFPREILFTASATEANNMALRGIPSRQILVAATEHSSVLKVVPSARLIPVDASGRIELTALERMLAATNEPVLISIMLANNETGVIQPLQEIRAIAQKYNALVHCDAVQAVGRLPIDFSALGADMLTLSSHKCGGPMGAAALVMRGDLPIQPMLAGGGQELGRRAGTENIPAIAGFAAVFEQNWSFNTDLKHWHIAMEEELMGYGAIIAGRQAERLPNTSCILMPGVSNEVQLMRFDLEGICVSAGSACSSGRIEPSHVLQAMGFSDKQAGTAIRVSSGWNTEPRNIAAFTSKWLQISQALAKAS